jgi:ABC-type transport system involved in cytochrome bd biosynthesis fused ATPase/permease subunit
MVFGVYRGVMGVLRLQWQSVKKLGLNIIVSLGILMEKAVFIGISLQRDINLTLSPGAPG